MLWSIIARQGMDFWCLLIHVTPFIAADMSRTNTESLDPPTSDTEDQNIVIRLILMLFHLIHEYDNA